MLRCVLAALVTSMLTAQAPAVAVADDVVDDAALLAAIEARCEQLRTDGGLHTCDELRAGADGRRCELPAVPLRTASCTTVQLRARLLPSTLIVGQYYHCEECGRFHFSASTGFAIGTDGAVATCFHVLEESPEDAAAKDDAGKGGSKDAHPTLLAVADWQGHVHAVTSVLAADRLADVAVLRTTATDLVPLPLRVDAAGGERVFCLSNPDHLFACFSEGLVARRFLVHGEAPGTVTVPPDSAAVHRSEVPVGPSHLYLQVTCDFGAGSSGGPIVDSCGNLLAMAQSTTTIAADDEGVDTQMVARTAVPAAALRAIVQR